MVRTRTRTRTWVRRFGCCGLALALASALGCQDDSATEAQTTTTARADLPPNLVLITLDTTRADSLGTYGQVRATSPSIDRIAREGTVFTSALASSPMTLPSHSTIFTGLHPYAHGIRSNAGFVLADRTLTLAEILRGEGYRTAAEIAVDVLRRQTGIDQGFEHYRGPGDLGVELKRVRSKKSGEFVAKPIRTGRDISRRGIEFMRANRAQPFFLWLHYFDAHHPYVVPSAIESRFPDSTYHAAVATMDAFVEPVFDEIEALGLRKETLVVVTADHGEGLGEHGEETHSYYVYDSTMHVPLIFWGLETIPKGRRVDDVVRTIDVLPTVLDLLGVSAPERGQGVSLVPLLRGRPLDEPLLGYGESFEGAAFFGLSPIRFVREGRWKYIHKVNPELYDIATDPGERVNLADRFPEVVERLRGRLETLLETAPARHADASAPIDAATAAQLQALGYLSQPVMDAEFDEVASLDVQGDDPVSRIETLSAITRTLELIEDERFDEALAKLLPLERELPESTYILSRLAETHAARGATRDAIETHQRILAIEPCNERSLTELNRLWKVVGDYDALVVTLREGSLACPDFAGNWNNLAWNLATLPRADLRDGDAAVRAAERALDVLRARPPAFLDTLAVALAEAGRFDEAIAVQTEALRTAEQERLPAALVEELRRHLADFREGEPIRSPSPSSPDEGA